MLCLGQLDLAAQTGVCGDILATHLGVLERIGLRRILLSLNHDPAFVAGLVEDVKYCIKVHAAVRIARYGERAVTDSLQEGPILIGDSVNNRHTHILQVNVTYTVRKLAQYINRILTRDTQLSALVISSKYT